MDLGASAGGLALALAVMGTCLMLWGPLRRRGLRRHRSARHLRDRTSAMLAHPALTGRAVASGLAGALDAATSGYTADPFRTLAVQLRLARLGAELRELDQHASRLTRLRRRQAALEAYDETLAEACRLAGAPMYRAAGMDRELGRQMEELSLSDRGWTW